MSDRPSEFDLHRWLDGELSPEEASEVERHLAEDPALRARLSDYARNEQLLRTALGVVEPEGVPPELDALGARLGSRLRGQRLRMVGPALAASLAAFAAGAASYPLLEPVFPWRLPSVVETAARAHEVFEATSEVEVPGAARGKLLARVERHLGADVAIPDLRSIGFNLLGGRLLVSEEGPLAQIIYEDNRRVRLTLYISDGEAVAAEEITVVEIDDLAAGYWRIADVAYSVVAEMDTERLRDVAVEISETVGAPRI